MIGQDSIRKRMLESCSRRVKSSKEWINIKKVKTALAVYLKEMEVGSTKALEECSVQVRIFFLVLSTSFTNQIEFISLI